MANLTIEDLKLQKRWVLWRLEPRPGETTLTKTPYQSNGVKARSSDPSTWVSCAAALAAYEAALATSNPFSGVGLVFGTVDGVQLSGVDIDNCCDAHTGKFTTESREIVIGLDSYSEFSPSGTGTHILVLGGLRGRKGLHEAYPGCKAIEIYDSGRYFTFTGRHLEKTPPDILWREDELNALYDRVRAAKPGKPGLTVSVSIPEAERLQQLMAGDTSAYGDDHSKADYALCCLLAKKYDCNAFKMNDEFEKSGLYRDKWDRDDYRENTIARAIKAVAREIPIVFDHEEIDDDSPTEYIVAAKPGELEGWFPKGELSLIGAASGRGKSSWMMPLLENVRRGEAVWGHPADKPRDYRTVLHDRSKKATMRTIKAQHLGQESIDRLVRLTREQQNRDPGETLASLIEQCPGVETWYIEGIDLWFGDANKMSDVAPILDNLGRVALQFDIAIVATVGSPKMKGKDRYYGRDSLFGSSALGRKVETVVLINLTDETDNNSARRLDALKRNGPCETFYFSFSPERGLYEVEKPAEKQKEEPKLTSPAMLRMGVLVAATFGYDQPVVYRERFGTTREFYAWRDLADQAGRVYKEKNHYYLTRQTGGTKLTLSTGPDL